MNWNSSLQRRMFAARRLAALDRGMAPIIVSMRSPDATTYAWQACEPIRLTKAYDIFCVAIIAENERERAIDLIVRAAPDAKIIHTSIETHTCLDPRRTVRNGFVYGIPLPIQQLHANEVLHFVR